MTSSLNRLFSSSVALLLSSSGGSLARAPARPSSAARSEPGIGRWDPSENAVDELVLRVEGYREEGWREPGTDLGKSGPSSTVGDCASRSECR